MSTKSINQRIKHEIRREARRMIDLLLYEQKYSCHWCKRLIVRLRGLLPDMSIREFSRLTGLIQKGEFVIVIGHWIENREPILARLATVDHLLPLDHPDTNSLENLRASCFECNQLRGKESEGILSTININY